MLYSLYAFPIVMAHIWYCISSFPYVLMFFKAFSVCLNAFLYFPYVLMLFVFLVCLNAFCAFPVCLNAFFAFPVCLNAFFVSGRPVCL